MGQKAERVISVRMPAGAVEELRAATGQPFSTLARWVLMALLEKKRAERANAVSDGQLEVRGIVAEMPERVPE